MKSDVLFTSKNKIKRRMCSWSSRSCRCWHYKNCSP